MTLGQGMVPMTVPPGYTTPIYMPQVIKDINVFMLHM